MAARKDKVCDGVGFDLRGGVAMSKFLVTYHGSEMPDDPALMEQAKAAFINWVGEAGDAIVDPGAPVRIVSQVASGTAEAPVEIGGYSIIQADSLDEAEAVLQSHPYVGRGGTLQLNEVIDV
jgi:hypothetical protein